MLDSELRNVDASDLQILVDEMTRGDNNWNPGEEGAQKTRNTKRRWPERRSRSQTSPALATDGGRSLLCCPTDQSGIGLGEHAGFLRLHDARRDLGDTISRRGRGDVRDVLRHKSLSTTHSTNQYSTLKSCSTYSATISPIRADSQPRGSFLQ